MTLDELKKQPDGWLSEDLEKGGKFVIFPYVFSLILITHKDYSAVYYIASYEHAIKHGWMYALISLIVGWWGIPWGPIYTLESLIRGFIGEDVTEKVLEPDEDEQENQEPEEYEEGESDPEEYEEDEVNDDEGSGYDASEQDETHDRYYNTEGRF